MGYRLHYAQHYAPEWKGGVFNWNSEGFEDMFFARFYDNGWKSENEDEYEVERQDVEAYIAELEKLPAGELNEFFPSKEDEITNQVVIDNLREILKSDDDVIRLSWF